MADYNDFISGANLAGNIPVEYVDEILKGSVDMSHCLKLAARLPDMPTATRVMPVLDALPYAYFSTPSASGTSVTAPVLAQTTNVKWRNVVVTAEELNVIVPIPLTAFDDARQPIWDRVKPLIEQAAGKAIDQAVLYGINAPSTWPASIVAQATADATSNVVSLAAVGGDMYEGLLGENGTLTCLEVDGYIATGHVAHPIMRGKLRGVRDAEGQPIFRTGMAESTVYNLDGSPIDFPTNGSIEPSLSLMVSGQWEELVFAFRQDLTWFVANQGVIQDGNGDIVYNLFQQRMIALMLTMRLGFALPNPVNPIEPDITKRFPFAVLVP